MKLPFTDLVFSNTKATGNERLVLLALSHKCDENGCCPLKVKEIAYMVNLSCRSVQRIIASLEKLGYVNREPRKNPDGSSMPNRYWLSAYRLIEEAAQ